MNANEKMNLFLTQLENPSEEFLNELKHEYEDFMRVNYPQLSLFDGISCGRIALERAASL